MTIDLDNPNLNNLLQQSDPCYWALCNEIKLMGNTTFTLDGCRYMQQIMRDPSRFMAVMKGAQARITTAFMLRCIHSLKYGLYPKGVIYYFPSRDAVEDFSKTRFTPLINDNPCIKKHLKSTDSVFVKRVGKSFLTLKGGTATKILKGRKKDSMSVRSTPADEVIRDERDLFDDDMVEMTKDRLLDSVFKREVDLGTPTMPDFGIAKVYALSDQKNSMSKCEACDGYTCLVDEFPNCVKYKRETTHVNYEPYFACIKCGKEIPVLDQEFVAKYPDREISGYHIPHLITPNCELKLVMSRWEEAQIDGSKLGTFYNSILGLPYMETEERLTESDVLACCGSDVMRTSVSINQTAMGVDVGKAYHTILIAEKIDAKRAKIVYMCRVKGFPAVHDIAKKYNVKSAVVDRRPYEEAFEQFQNTESYRVFGAQYPTSPKARNPFLKTDEKAGTYTVNKIQIFDKTHLWVKNKEIEIPRKCAEVDEFARQLCNCGKYIEENDTGDRIYVYLKLGDQQDHYRNALHYLYIALGDLTAYQGMAAVGYGGGTESSYDPLEWEL